MLIKNELLLLRCAVLMQNMSIYYMNLGEYYMKRVAEIQKLGLFFKKRVVLMKNLRFRF